MVLLVVLLPVLGVTPSLRLLLLPCAALMLVALHQDWEDALATVVVRRGAGAMPVGEPIPATLPDQARRVQ